jgi:thioredoxin-related protein
MPLPRNIFTTALAALAFSSLALLYTGCATAVDKSEVEQKANPVKEMHQEVAKAQEAEKNKLQWYSYEDALVKARKEGKFVMVDFYATWCKWCKKLDSDTYADPKVVEALRADFIPVKVDSESSAKTVYEMRQVTMSELADKYGVSSYPALWFLDKDGNKAKLLNGYLPPQDFLAYLRYIKGGKYKEMDFEEYMKKVEGRG